MAAGKTKSLFSLSTLLASFFGAAMIAAAFAYFNYKFSEYKFIDFHDWVFYQEKAIFTPTEPYYIVVLYSSNVPGAVEKLMREKAKYPILAIDYYQKAPPSNRNVIFLRSGTNTTLKFIQRFNVYHSPTVFTIKKNKETLYKQDSMIRELDTLEGVLTGV
ncbi:MAG: hypothetical protein AB7U44_05025 [Sulfuricurvum sp.]|uniref:hypothetical protein n=1 Tax=Sulfuricurvum sp. TaxID=2025608 RepID=UPI002627A3D4|nr:hypothetical protein [Sulfuricurvum sp.]MDD2837694.1 hypothetical protein [Sulfuricurvum sp.]MDD3597047.1 hypothetical protein [Sulfuricurvum sp.]MDD4885059.1 hypothetical protein [Sulfuricurvum sp.]